MTTFEVVAYGLSDDSEGLPTVSEVARAEVTATSMTKGSARAALAKVKGSKLPQGLDVRWKPISQVTYAMPIDKFIADSVVIKTESLVTPEPDTSVETL